MEKRVRFTTVAKQQQCIIEFQSFIGNLDEFIVKELVIMNLETNVVNYFLFKPPHGFKKLSIKAQKTNNWLTRHFHMINWNEGFTQYKELDNIMYHYCQQYGTIYTTGLKKCQFISQYTTDKVVNLLIGKQSDFNVGNGFCTSVKNEQHKIANCALVKTYKILSVMGKIYDCNKTCDGGGGKPYIKREHKQSPTDLEINTA